MKNFLRWVLVYGVVVLLIFSLPFIHKQYILHQVGARVVKLVGQRGMGTGFLVKSPKSGKSYVLTNHHVCRLAVGGKLVAITQFGVEELKVIKKSNFTDLCLLSPIRNIGGLNLANGTYSNQEVAAVGFPYGMQLTLTRGGIIGGQVVNMVWGIIGQDLEEKDCKGPMFRQMPIMGFQFQKYNMYKRDKYEFLPYYLKAMHDNSVDSDIEAPAPPNMACVATIREINTTIQVLGGNSGSPVIDIMGNVVGVVFARYSEAAWGAMIPLADVKKFLEKY